MAPSDYLSQMFSLEGKSVIATGATGGLGKSMVLAMVQARAKDIVSIELPGDKGSAALAAEVKEAGGSVRLFPCNVADGAALRATYSKIWEAGVVPDILLNCAGTSIRMACEDVTDEAIDLVRFYGGMSVPVFIEHN